MFWHRYGKIHRENVDPKTGRTLPAVIYLDGPLDIATSLPKAGKQEWFINDEKHCDDGPAEINKYGTKSWYRYGKIDRSGLNSLDPETGLTLPAVIYTNGPLDIATGLPGEGTKEWYRNGEFHRTEKIL